MATAQNLVNTIKYQKDYLLIFYLSSVYAADMGSGRFYWGGGQIPPAGAPCQIMSPVVPGFGWCPEWISAPVPQVRQSIFHVSISI
jgi:hypothetical protein